MKRFTARDGRIKYITAMAAIIICCVIAAAAGKFLRGGRIALRPAANAAVFAPSGTPGDGKININLADEAALMALPGVGEVTARAIITHREAQGGFSDIAEIMDVPGIGAEKNRAIMEMITAD